MAATGDPTAVVLSGGGARAAYQIGALRGVARILGRGAHSPFPVISGTSAGAINAAALAAHADRFRDGVAHLTRLWRKMRVESVYKADLRTLSSHGMRWLASVLTGGRGPPRTASMFDNSPLHELLRRELDRERIDAQMQNGHLRALAINATSYTTGHAVTFYQGVPAIVPWQRMRRRGEPATIEVDHLLASTAIPFIFPAARIADDYYADGSVRQIAPLSPALHLGARRMLVIAVGQFCGQTPRFGHAAAVSFVRAGRRSRAVEHLSRQPRRRPRAAAADQSGAQTRSAARAAASSRIRACRCAGALSQPRSRRIGNPSSRTSAAGVRYLLHGLGSTEGTGANLLSYLLFDQEYCRELLALGYADAIARATKFRLSFQATRRASCRCFRRCC